MQKLSKALELIDEYQKRYRHPKLEQFLISKLYDLAPEQMISELPFGVQGSWPDRWPNAEMGGVYLFLSNELDVLYIGSTKGFGKRFSSYFQYGENQSCKILHNWELTIRFIVTVAVPKESWFESAAIEAYLIEELQPPTNTNGIRKQ